jgi:serine protease AprX
MLLSRTEVRYVTPDRPVRGALEFAVPTIGADLALRAGWDGEGVSIAVIDSGINKKSEDLGLIVGPVKQALASRVIYEESFVPGDRSPQDRYGHGTHVAGILAGNAANSTGPTFFRTFRGVAPAVRLVNLKVLDDQGRGSDSSVIAAIERAIQLKNALNIRVINLSVGRPVFESFRLDPLCQAVERAWRAGIVVVVAAGNYGRINSFNNSGYGTITAPANDPFVITVGAMKDMGTLSRADDRIASYSSKGPTLADAIVKPDLVAPGNRIISVASPWSLLTSASTANRVPWTYYSRLSLPGYSTDYVLLSGTSMAAPMAAATAAAMLQKDPSLTPDTIKARLMKTATKTFPLMSTAYDPTTGRSYTSYYDIFTVGAGYLDSWAALNSTDQASGLGSAASPRVSFDSSSRTLRVVNGTYAPWAAPAIWGTSSAWGIPAVWGTSAFSDGSASVWGASTVTTSVDALSAAWGTYEAEALSAAWGTYESEAMSRMTGGEN